MARKGRRYGANPAIPKPYAQGAGVTSDAQGAAEFAAIGGGPRGLNPRPPSLFIGMMPAGITYADRSKEVSGDYKRIAFLPYDTLELKVYDPRSPLLAAVKADAAQYKAGTDLEVTWTGQTRRLGSRA